MRRESLHTRDDYTPEQLEIRRLADINNAYGELFADLITVLYYKDPAIILRTIPNPLTPGTHQYEIYDTNRWTRSLCNTRNRLETFDFSQTYDIEGGWGVDNHKSTAPARYALCEKFFLHQDFSGAVAVQAQSAIDESIFQLSREPHLKEVNLDGEEVPSAEKSLRIINELFIKNLGG